MVKLEFGEENNSPGTIFNLKRILVKESEEYIGPGNSKQSTSANNQSNSRSGEGTEKTSRFFSSVMAASNEHFTMTSGEYIAVIIFGSFCEHDM